MRDMHTILLSALLLAAPPENWDTYQNERAADCYGAMDSLKTPEVREHKGYEFTFEGYRVRVRKKPADTAKEMRFGVLSGIKSLDAATKKALKGYFDKFEAAKVTGIIVGGDSGDELGTISEVLEFVAKRNLPTFAIAGNWEPTVAFNQATRELSKTYPNLINMDLARLVDLEGVDLIGMGGYLDRNYVKGKGACVYPTEAVEELPRLANGADDPVVLVSHGPPRQEGSDAIDFVPGKGNVGDPEMTAALDDAKIHFGIFGHIVEAGGRAADEKGRSVAPGDFSKSLYLNPGPATAQPRRLTAGGTSYGMAAILTVKGKTASYELLRASGPKE